MTEQVINLKDFSLEELESYLGELGEPPYRARQVAGWIFQKGAGSFSEMTNLPSVLRERMEHLASPGSLSILKKQVSSRGDTVKYLFGLHDGQAVESVLMSHSYGRSVCISTQVGCRMGCSLCASTLGGVVRNLSPGEMYDQVLAVQKDSGTRVSHIVLMGTGEPLDNYDSTVKFLRNVNAAYGLNIGFRHITLSTCGVVPRMNQLAGEGFPLTLAVSLHAAENGLRDKLVPMNRKYPLDILMQACSYYNGKTGRRISFEYALLSGVNDSPEQAARLAGLVRKIPCHVNLIPYNPVGERQYKRSSPEKVKRFRSVLEQHGIETTVRRELGTDIDAACGQLRRQAALRKSLF
ncbi:MAG: ribosomal RNA large subunit methyltransferase N [Peptococcaceae bacterium BICA1-7]|nr:MAG: ribosomal RNA large subunit methyltransferase N [Peptococcaceae bacterium BICA1-7]HBV99541.1 23S rRNA (adenine(2503)-C(2))-methyltransferase RlmN [Desulfotomaculum sp.]